MVEFECPSCDTWVTDLWAGDRCPDCGADTSDAYERSAAMAKAPAVKAALARDIGALARLPTPTSMSELAAFLYAIKATADRFAAVVDTAAFQIRRELDKGDTGGVLPPEVARRLAAQAADAFHAISAELEQAGTKARHVYPAIVRLYADELGRRPEASRSRRGFNFEE